MKQTDQNQAVKNRSQGLFRVELALPSPLAAGALIKPCEPGEGFSVLNSGLTVCSSCLQIGEANGVARNFRKQTDRRDFLLFKLFKKTQSITRRMKS